jgi:Ni/Co efflux regulator RcnB
MPHFRQTAILTAAAMAAALTAAQAQTTVITREQPVQTETVVTQQPLQLSPVQRQTVYRTIVRERVVTAQPAVTYHVGTRVPQTAQLYSVPETVAVEVPEVRSYKYMVVNDQVVLVDPATGEVVAELAN